MGMNGCGWCWVVATDHVHKTELERRERKKRHALRAKGGPHAHTQGDAHCEKMAWCARRRLQKYYYNLRLTHEQR